jgi:predicted ABC-type ATPase
MAGPQVTDIAGPNGAGKSTLAPYFLRDRLGLSGYVNADTIALGLSAFRPEEVAFEAGRVVAGGHDVPEEIIRRRYRKGVVNFFSLDQPMADTWGVYDNSALFDPVLIAAGEKTTWGVLSHDLWHEFCEAAK